MKTESPISLKMIAPCGMNCGICVAHLRPVNTCPGCWGDAANKSKSCVTCSIINCVHIKHSKLKFCSECEKYPCPRLKQLDKRYRTKYGMSMLENLETIRRVGKRKFVKAEIERWKCAHCGNTICVHRENCLSCGQRRKMNYLSPRPGLNPKKPSA